MNYAAQKRLLDLLSAATLLVLFLPVWLIVPLLIKLDTPGPIIYRHKRIGKGGRPFDILKFRSMIDGAHEYLHQKNPALLAKFKQSDWKLADDPRITRLGKILRSITVDEWPQLINVLKGDMSLVGPRAYMKEEIDCQTQKYPETQALIKDILSVKPGITGPWQVAGRNDVPFNKRAELDARYARQKNILNDLKIMLKTPKAMFSKW